jgi:hypothetical protein
MFPAFQGGKMKSLLMGSLLLVASVSQADVIKCVFTEPFVNTVYSMTQSSLTYSSAGEDKPVVIKNVSFQIKAAGVFELVSKDGKVLQTLTLNNNGSDGMSDTVFPYEVKDNNEMMTVNNGIGGCTSNYQKAVDPVGDGK